MKMKYFHLLVIVAVVMLLSACSRGTPTAVSPTEPTSTSSPPTDAPPTSGDPVWDRVQAAGKIEFGTSADYKPFEYYDASYQIGGFDAELARELGARLGLQVELVDIAFESLPTALQIGQIDAAIAAISVTPERQAVVDFTNVYYSGQDMILAHEGSGIEAIVVPAQLAQYRVGVQRGSAYASWLQNTLVASGLMPEANLLQYSKAEHAVRDLKENRNELVILDKLAADLYILSGGVISVGQDLNTQLFAIALPKGATRLQAELNAALTELQNDGTIARLTEEFLDIEVPTPAPVPTTTAIPGPTATPSGCTDGMEFVRDVQVPDGTVMRPGQDFDKIWRIRNTGTCTWSGDYKLVFVRGDRMDGSSEAVTTTVRSGDTYDVIIDQKAPNAPGKYTGIWQMVNPNRTPFGERILVKITVPGAEGTPTAVPPTATPVPTMQPTLAPAPIINYLNVSSEAVQQGGLLVMSWSFSGESLQSARLTRTNPDGTLTALYGGADVELRGEYEDLMMNPGLYAYTLNVASEFGGTTVKTVVVYVTSSGYGADLIGSEWTLVRFINPVKPDEELTPINGTELSVAFNFDGSLTGSTGCNPFSTTYAILGSDSISISDSLTTGQAICDQEIMGQEALYLDLLVSIKEFDVGGDELVLRGEIPDPAQNDMLDIFTYQKRLMVSGQ